MSAATSIEEEGRYLDAVDAYEDGSATVDPGWLDEQARQFRSLPLPEKRAFLVDPEGHLEGVMPTVRAEIAQRLAATAQSLDDLAVAAAFVPPGLRRPPSDTTVKRLSLAIKVARVREAESRCVQAGHGRSPRRQRRLRRTSASRGADPPPGSPAWEIDLRELAAAQTDDPDAFALLGFWAEEHRRGAAISLATRAGWFAPDAEHRLLPAADRRSGAWSA